MKDLIWIISNEKRVETPSFIVYHDEYNKSLYICLCHTTEWSLPWFIFVYSIVWLFFLKQSFNHILQIEY